MGQKPLTPGGVFADAVRARLLSRLGGEGQLNRNTLAPEVADVVSRPRLYRVLAGEQPMTVAEFGAICAALKVPVATIVREAERLTRSAPGQGIELNLPPESPSPGRAPHMPTAHGDQH